LPDLHIAMGVAAPPQTPATIRGGGSSLFSLPEESGAETPHTSNVSLGTSIASGNTYSARHEMRPHLILQQDGLQLRQTVHIVTSLLQKLSMACLELGELSSKSEVRKYVLACDNIKRFYLQLLAVKKGDALALMNAFYLESLESSSSGAIITREVSADEADLRIIPTQSRDSESAILPPTMSAAVLTGASQSQQGGGTSLFAVDRLVSSRPFGVPVLPTYRREDTFNHHGDDHQPSASRGMSLFSPSTEDMRSKASEQCVPYEFDDLRRQVGSYDRDDHDDSEERDGPCDDEYETRVDTDDWRQMYQNVSLAASSLRSLRRQTRASGRSI
jgi:hypothetical protein